MQDAFEVFELLAAARGLTCVAALRAVRGAVCPTECEGCGDNRWRAETRTHLAWPVPGRGAAAPVDLEDLIEVAEQPDRMDLAGAFLCPACGGNADPLGLVRYEEPPRVLATQLMRFRVGGATLAKSPARCPRYLRFLPDGLRGPLSSCARGSCMMASWRLGISCL